MRVLSCFCILAAAACSTTPAISLSAPTTSIPGDGETPVEIDANVTEGGSPSDGVQVHFVTTDGTFKDALTGDATTIDATTTTGKAAVTLIPPRKGWGTVTITATASVQGQAPKATATINLAPSGGLASRLSFSCKNQNIGAFVTGRQEDIHVLCVATAYDALNHVIPKASVQTLTEAGSLDWTTDDTGGQQFVYTVAPDAAPPADVDPWDANGNPLAICPSGCTAAPGSAYDATACPGEPCWLDSRGLIHNPRDGVATLIAAVPGVKMNDTYGEPFADFNDNGVRDPGEPYIDYNGNGKWDGPDGKLKDLLVWKAFRIIWSGEADRSTSNHASYITTSVSGTTGTATIRVHDVNFNSLSADGAAGNDAIELTAGQCVGGAADGSVTTNAQGLAMEQADPGIAFKTDGSIDYVGGHSTWLRKTEYSFQAFFTGTSGGQACGVDTLPNRQFDPGAPGFEPIANINTELLPATFHF